MPSPRFVRSVLAAALAAGGGPAACVPTRLDMKDPHTLFLVADRSRDGLASRNEFTAFAIAEAFARTDTRRDGFLTLAEYTAAGGNRATFEFADEWKTGRVSVNGFQRTPALRRQMGAHFDQADANRDGYLNKAEFLSLRAKPPVPLR